MAPESDQGQPSQDTAESSADSGTLQEGKGTEKGKDKEEKDKEKAKDPEKDKGKEKDAERKGDVEKEKVKGLEGTSLDALLQRLPGCVSRDLIDQLTVIILLPSQDLLFYVTLLAVMQLSMTILLLCSSE